MSAKAGLINNQFKSLKLKRLSSENNAKHCYDYERTLLDTIDLRTDFELNIYLL